MQTAHRWAVVFVGLGTVGVACHDQGGALDDAGFIRHAGPNSMMTKGGTDEAHLRKANTPAHKDPPIHNMPHGGDAGPTFDR